LYLYHGKCHQTKQLQNNEIKHDKLWNEGATILSWLVLKNAVNWIYGVIGIISFQFDYAWIVTQKKLEKN
jgi:putative membrane protein